MNADTCKDFLKALELYHDRKFSKQARDAYWGELKDVSDERILLVLQVSYGKFPPGRVPSINDFKALLADLRDTTWNKEKSAELANRYPLSRSRPRSQMGRESFQLINRLFLQGKPEGITARQCVDEMLKMEEKYSNVGWRRSAEELSAWLNKKRDREKSIVDKELREIELQAQEELAKEKTKGAE